ncbi:MAG: bifunctional 4-hydroxy-3-methylbut-2-enyl diphosphate reductase/30S ribosomal protein S1 [Lachnospiraceae bacterium]|nr:bifunctional 4-hydroxy-3-methylbut-2-enyl diphosphate reductase/30S ribosomal protein S1 [Lachnospiraceae bacterium]
MKVILAKHAGFCFGVKRAVDMAYAEADKEHVYTYGPIIHNEEVIKDLESKGVKLIHSLDELKALDDENATIVLRSHGVGKSVYKVIEEKGYNYVDTACPFVKKIHKLVGELDPDNERAIVVGNKEHPEVVAICEWCTAKPIVISDASEISGLKLDDNYRYRLVSQTTFNYNKFQDIVEILQKKGYYIEVCNTICNATEERQSEAAALAKEVDAMIVIGGKNSSNTQKLYDISREACANTYYIQTLVDLDLTMFESVGSVGITAGASTPHNIIKEVHDSMAEESFDELLEESFKEKNNVRPGATVEGTVISVKEDEIVLNIGYKADGIISRNEYTNEPGVDLTTKVSAGDKMNAKVVKVNDGEGQVLLSYKKLAADKSNEKLEEAFNNKEVLTGKVIEVRDGGLIVSYEESRVFIPASLVSDQFERNLNKYQNQDVTFVITEFNPSKRRIIGDRKQLLAAEHEEQKKQLFDRINVGDVVDGTVKNLTDFGAFVDLGGADGLLHISEMSWGHVENPKKMFKVGQEVKVLIKDIQGEKIALSLKFDDQNPWLTASEKYAVGNIVTGKVARMTDFGAFIELEPGVDALLHVSQISLDRIEKPASVLKIGQEVTAEVVDLKPEDHKISLSIKKTLKPEETEASEEVVEVDASEIADAVELDD